MIRNDKQLDITRNRIQEFGQSYSMLQDKPNPNVNDSSGILHKAQLDRLRNTIKELKQKAEVYITLRDGAFPVVTGGQIYDIARILIQARIAKGWSQSDLARAMQIEPQQIQRYEATDYEGAGILRIFEVVDALAISLKFEDLTVRKENSKIMLVNTNQNEDITNRGHILELVA